MNLKYHAEACRGSTRRWKPYGYMVSGAVVDQIMGGAMPPWIAPNGVTLSAGDVVVCDHEDHLWGLTRGWFKRDAETAALNSRESLSSIITTLRHMIPQGVSLAQYGVCRLHRWFDVPHGPTGQGVERLREFPDEFNAERQWHDEYQWPAVKGCDVITPCLYVMADPNGALGRNEIEWAKLTIEFARRDGRRIMPIVSPRWNGGGQVMPLTAWMRFVQDVLYERLQPDDDVMVWDAMDHTIWQATCDLPPHHGGYAYTVNARAFIDAEIGKQDWSEMHGASAIPRLQSAYRKFYAKHIEIMEMAADALRQRGAA